MDRAWGCKHGWGVVGTGGPRTRGVLVCVPWVRRVEDVAGLSRAGPTDCAEACDMSILVVQERDPGREGTQEGGKGTLDGAGEKF